MPETEVPSHRLGHLNTLNALGKDGVRWRLVDGAGTWCLRALFVEAIEATAEAARHDVAAVTLL